jgi:hypothetical protein
VKHRQTGKTPANLVTLTATWKEWLMSLFAEMLNNDLEKQDLTQ